MGRGSVAGVVLLFSKYVRLKFFLSNILIYHNFPHNLSIIFNFYLLFSFAEYTQLLFDGVYFNTCCARKYYCAADKLSNVSNNVLIPFGAVIEEMAAEEEEEVADRRSRG